MSLCPVSSPLHSQFLDIDEGGKKKEADKGEKKAKSLPPYVARNVRARLMPGIKGAVRITWDVSGESDEDFIVGRTQEIPFSPERALQATSVKVVPAGADRSVIDTNLPPGQYYYVVLAKQKVMDKEVELFPNVNYITVPVIIERDFGGVDSEEAPELVTLIHAMVTNKTHVVLTWKGVRGTGIIYTIYRGTSPLGSPKDVKRSKKLAVITDGKESFIDRTITKTGNYYYAVTTKDMAGNEELQLVPDQSYMTAGVFIAFNNQNIVSNLTATLASDKTVRLSWDGVDMRKGEYLIYRDRAPISDSEKLALAEYLGSVPNGVTRYTDKATDGKNFYYAVIVKMPDGAYDTALVEGANYTVDPPGGKIKSGITAISARFDGKDVQVKWRSRGDSGSGEYQIVRSSKRLKRISSLKGLDVLGSVSLEEGQYVDREPPAGRYYYALVSAGKGRQSFKSGVNITRKAVMVKKGRTEPEFAQEEEPAEADGNVDEILRKTFFKGEYRLALSQLMKVTGESESASDTAKARLFIGRSYIEMKKYREALDYLLLPDVKKYFPEEAKFWSSYALSRIR